jgi:hypothetical protein
MIRASVFVGVQIVNLVAGGLIVVFCKRYEGEVCPFHRNVFQPPERRGVGRIAVAPARMEKRTATLEATGGPR